MPTGTWADTDLTVDLLRPSNTNRDYLSRWFPDHSICVTDCDIWHPGWFRELRTGSAWILDLTHNSGPHDLNWSELPPEFTVLTNDFDRYYRPQDNIRFFPLFLWMYSCRLPLFFPQVTFDRKSRKRQDMMCLNYQTRYHRTQLRCLLDPVIHLITYSLDRSGLPGEASLCNDVGISHAAYVSHAVNIVTETSTHRPYVSEKTCKPFMAQQIPVIVGSQGINRFLSDLGLDLFPDLVPWTLWDHVPAQDDRLFMIAAFLRHWLERGTVLQDYADVLHRVEANKRYFHSQQFQDRLLAQMPPPIIS